MSTRAHIRVIDSSGIIMLYHHCDGYPDGIGRDLKSVLDKICDDPEYGCRDLIQNKLGLNALDTDGMNPLKIVLKQKEKK